MTSNGGFKCGFNSVQCFPCLLTSASPPQAWCKCSLVEEWGKEWMNCHQPCKPPVWLGNSPSHCWRPFLWGHLPQWASAVRIFSFQQFLQPFSRGRQGEGCLFPLSKGSNDCLWPALVSKAAWKLELQTQFIFSHVWFKIEIGNFLKHRRKMMGEKLVLWFCWMKPYDWWRRWGVKWSVPRMSWVNQDGASLVPSQEQSGKPIWSPWQSCPELLWLCERWSCFSN